MSEQTITPMPIALANADKILEQARVAHERYIIKHQESDLEKALELDPNFVDALYAMGAAQKKVENYHKALEFLNRAIELQPDFVHAKALQKLILTKYLKEL